MRVRVGRREWLERALLVIGGAALGGVARRARQASPAPAPDHARPKATEEALVALSLAELQTRARAANPGALPPEIAQLAGLTQIRGLIANDRDVVLLGHVDPAAPPIHMDALMVAFRSAYLNEQDPLYRDSPGCTIDPRDGQRDPWAIQDVRVLGMPRCEMASRHVALDYELKFVGAGIVRLDGVPSSFEAPPRRRLCETAVTAPHQRHDRFWFAPRYPDVRPRFEADGSTVLIRHPVDVQVLTERQLRHGEHTESVSDRSDAEAFARGVSALLASGARRDYVALRNDFRVVEVGRLCRFRETPPAVLTYLLHEHRHQPVDVPAFVVGVKRTDTTDLVCGGDVEVTEREIRSRAQIRHFEQSYRGGVDAAVTITPEQIAAVDGRFAALRQRVERARPAPNALLWPVPR